MFSASSFQHLFTKQNLQSPRPSVTPNSIEFHLHSFGSQQMHASSPFSASAEFGNGMSNKAGSESNLCGTNPSGTSKKSCIAWVPLCLIGIPTHCVADNCPTLSWCVGRTPTRFSFATEISSFPICRLSKLFATNTNKHPHPKCFLKGRLF